MENEQPANKRRKNIWIIRSKEGSSILEMPDGRLEFNTEYEAQSVLRRYKHKDKYMVLMGTTKVDEKNASKVDDFLGS